jgi:hypothetical protein
LCKQHQAGVWRAALGQREPHLAADDQVQSLSLGLRMRAHYPRDRTLISEGQRAVAQFMRTLDQLLRMRGTVRKLKLLRQCSSA